MHTTYCCLRALKVYRAYRCMGFILACSNATDFHALFWTIYVKVDAAKIADLNIGLFVREIPSGSEIVNYFQ